MLRSRGTGKPYFFRATLLPSAAATIAARRQDRVVRGAESQLELHCPSGRWFLLAGKVSATLPLPLWLVTEALTTIALALAKIKPPDVQQCIYPAP
jgi:hypothetical protein